MVLRAAQSHKNINKLFSYFESLSKIGKAFLTHNSNCWKIDFNFSSERADTIEFTDMDLCDGREKMS